MTEWRRAAPEAVGMRSVPRRSATIVTAHKQSRIEELLPWSYAVT